MKEPGEVIQGPRYLDGDCGTPFKKGDPRDTRSFWERHFGGHFNLGPITVYGWNAMHVAVNIRTKRWGYICFHPTWKVFGKWWHWYFYISRDATPHAASFKVGPGLYE